MRDSYRTYIDGRWGQIHVRIAPGPSIAPPLLMLHQTPKSGWIWEPLFHHLAPGRTLIAPDTPGYGASDGPGAPVAIEDYAAEMLDLMDHLNDHGVAADRPFDVIGYHTGSLTAVAVANLAPARARRLVLVSLGVFGDDERAARLAAIPAKMPLSPDGSHLLAMWQMIDGFTDPRASLRWKQDSLTENLRCGDGFHHGYEAVFRHDFKASLARLDHETLIINPEDDLWHHTRSAASIPKRGTLLELKNAGHGIFAIAPAWFGKMISPFLDAP